MSCIIELTRFKQWTSTSIVSLHNTLFERLFGCNRKTWKWINQNKLDVIWKCHLAVQFLTKGLQKNVISKKVIQLLCSAPYKWNNDVLQMTLLQSMIKKVTMHFYVRWRKRGRELTTGETERERECVRSRGSEERGIASVQRSRHA